MIYLWVFLKTSLVINTTCRPIMGGRLNRLKIVNKMREQSKSERRPVLINSMRSQLHLLLQTPRKD
jgi:hypothetical protein